MPTFVVTAPDGRTLRLTGDEPPTDSDLDEIFASLPPTGSPPPVVAGGTLSPGEAARPGIAADVEARTEAAAPDESAMKALLAGSGAFARAVADPVTGAARLLGRSGLGGSASGTTARGLASLLAPVQESAEAAEFAAGEMKGSELGAEVAGAIGSGLGSMVGAVATGPASPVVTPVLAGFQGFESTRREALRFSVAAGIAPAEAEKVADRVALQSGLITGTVTGLWNRYGGRIGLGKGVERGLSETVKELTRAELHRSAARPIAQAVLREFAGEATEEATDQLLQEVLVRRQYDGTATLRDSFVQVVKSGFLGGVAGAAVGGPGAAAEVVGERAAAFRRERATGHRPGVDDVDAPPPLPPAGVPGDTAALPAPRDIPAAEDTREPGIWLKFRTQDGKDVEARSLTVEGIEATEKWVKRLYPGAEVVDREIVEARPDTRGEGVDLAEGATWAERNPSLPAGPEADVESQLEAGRVAQRVEDLADIEPPPIEEFSVERQAESGSDTLLDFVEGAGGINYRPDDRYAGELDALRQTLAEGDLSKRTKKRLKGLLKTDGSGRGIDLILEDIKTADALGQKNWGRIESPDDLVASLTAAIDAEGRVNLTPDERQTYWEAVISSRRGRSAVQNGGQAVPVERLDVGDQFRVRGRLMRVERIDPVDGFVQVIQEEGAPLWERQQIPPGEFFPDRNSYRPVAPPRLTPVASVTEPEASVEPDNPFSLGPRGTVFALGGRGQSQDGLSVEAVEDAIRRVLRVGRRLPARLRVVSDPEWKYAGRIVEGARRRDGSLVLNAAALPTEGDALRVLRHELLHDVWEDPATREAWAGLRAAMDRRAREGEARAEGYSSGVAEEAALDEVESRVDRRAPIFRRWVDAITRALYRRGRADLAGALFGRDVLADVDAKALVGYAMRLDRSQDGGLTAPKTRRSIGRVNPDARPDRDEQQEPEAQKSGQGSDPTKDEDLLGWQDGVGNALNLLKAPSGFLVDFTSSRLSDSSYFYLISRETEERVASVRISDHQSSASHPVHSAYFRVPKDSRPSDWVDAVGKAQKFFNQIASSFDPISPSAGERLSVGPPASERFRIEREKWEQEQRDSEHLIRNAMRPDGTIALVDSNAPHQVVFISKEPVDNGKWRATRFDNRVPYGHVVFENRDEAIASFSGQRTKGRGLPEAYPGQFVPLPDSERFSIGEASSRVGDAAMGKPREMLVLASPEALKQEVGAQSQAGRAVTPFMGDLARRGALLADAMGARGRVFSSWSRRMVADLGPEVRPFLGRTWENVRDLRWSLANNLPPESVADVNRVERAADVATSPADKRPTPVYDPEKVAKWWTPTLKKSSVIRYFGGDELLRKKQLLDMETAYQAAAVRKQSDILRGQLDDAFYGDNAGPVLRWFRQFAPKAKLRRFTRLALPIAGHLHVTGGTNGAWLFEDFDQRAGFLPEKTALKDGVATGDSVFRVNPVTGEQELLRLGDRIELESGKVGYQLLRPMPADRQARLYQWAVDQYPEFQWFLDAWIDPRLKDSRVIVNGVEVPVFNRGALASRYAQGDPSFASRVAYTPDVSLGLSLAGAVKKYVKERRVNFAEGTRSPGRKYDTGTAREAGDVLDLLSGFNVRAMQVLQEEVRQQWSKDVLAAAADIPREGLPKGWMPIESAMAEVWAAVRTMRKFDDPLNFPQTTARMGGNDSPEYRQFFGELARLRAGDMPKMIPRPLVEALVEDFGDTANVGLAGRIARAWARNWKSLLLLMPDTFVENRTDNYLRFLIQAHRQLVLAAIRGGDALAFREARKLAWAGIANMVPGVRPLFGLNNGKLFARVREEVLPDEIFTGGTRLQDLWVEKGSAEEEISSLREQGRRLRAAGVALGNIGPLALEKTGYGQLDVRAKKQYAFTLLMARAAQEARSQGLRGQAAREFAERWVVAPPEEAVRGVVESANRLLLNYADTPGWLGKFARLPVANLAVAFPLFRYHFIGREIDRATAAFRGAWRSAVRGKKLTREQLTESLADTVSYLTLPLMGYGAAKVAEALSDSFVGGFGGGDDDDDPRNVVGASSIFVEGEDGEPVRKPLPRELVTANRVNLSELLRGVGMDTSGSDSDFWWHIKDYPIIRSTALLYLAGEDARKQGPAAGIRTLMRGLKEMLLSLMGTGQALKVPEKIFKAIDEDEGGRPAELFFDPYGTSVPLNAYLTSQALNLIPGQRQANEIMKWLDPVPRRLSRSKALDYKPGVKEALQAEGWTGLADRIARGMRGEGFASELPPQGRINRRLGIVEEPREFNLSSRIAMLLGQNVRPIPREEYREALDGGE